MSRARTVMILGAGHEHLPLIHCAVDRGLEVVTVDHTPGNVGHRRSHRFVNVSTVDAPGVLEAARALSVDGILTLASDVAVPAIALVAEQMGLPGPSRAAASTMSDKAAFREFQRSHGLRHPGFVVADTGDALIERLGGLRAPLLLKPTDTSGSRGLTRIDDPDPDRVRPAFEHAQRFSRSGRVCAEECLEGPDLSGDGFVRDGELVSLTLTDKRARSMVPVGHRIPSPLDAAARARIQGEAARTCQLLGYTQGPFDFDVVLAPDGPHVLEMSPRLGGNSIPVLIERGTGVDLIAASLDYAMGQEPRLPAVPSPEVTRPCGVHLFGARRAGRLVSVADEAQLRRAVPGMFGYTLKREVGEHVDAFEHSGNSLGWVLFDCVSAEEYDRCVERIQATLAISVAGEA